MYFYWLMKLVQGVWQSPDPSKWDYLPEYPKEAEVSDNVNWVRVKPVAHRSSS